MAGNLYLDFPERVKQIEKFSGLRDLYGPLEKAFGDSTLFTNADEAIEVYRATMIESGKICAEEIMPLAAQLDEEGATLKDGKVSLPAALEGILQKLTQMGTFAAPVSRQYGGLNLPRPLQAMMLEMLGHACPNTALTVANFSMGDFIQTFGTESQKAEYLPKIMNNEWRTSMALTEPQAGSDLAQLKTTSRKVGDHYLINGSKRFITSGNADISFVLVRSDPKSQGLQGLSVMIVPNVHNGTANFQVPKIEDKVCLHSSPTCELIFEDSIGYLLGNEGEGFRVMLELMNTARLAMGALATGIASRAFSEAKNYATQRITMGKPILHHPMVADMLYEMELEIGAMRALYIETALAYDLLKIAQAEGDKPSERRWTKRYRRLTPLVKYLCAEKAVTITKNAMQIFGGYGVCKDYPVERLHREALIYPIYEGTSQIQSLMVLKDTLKDVACHASGFLGSLAGAWAESLLATDPIKSKLLEARGELNAAIKCILMSIIRDKFRADIGALRETKIQDFLSDYSLKLVTEKTDLKFPFLLAERLTRICSDYYALKCLVDRHESSDSERTQLILDYAELILPRMRMENDYMVRRLPSTLRWLSQFEEKSVTAAEPMKKSGWLPNLNEGIVPATT